MNVRITTSGTVSTAIVTKEARKTQIQTKQTNTRFLDAQMETNSILTRGRQLWSEVPRKITCATLDERVERRL